MGLSNITIIQSFFTFNRSNLSGQREIGNSLRVRPNQKTFHCGKWSVKYGNYSSEYTHCSLTCTVHSKWNIIYIKPLEKSLFLPVSVRTLGRLWTESGHFALMLEILQSSLEIVCKHRGWNKREQFAWQSILRLFIITVTGWCSEIFQNVNAAQIYIWPFIDHYSHTVHLDYGKISYSVCQQRTSWGLTRVRSVAQITLWKP